MPVELSAEDRGRVAQIAERDQRRRAGHDDLGFFERDNAEENVRRRPRSRALSFSGWNLMMYSRTWRIEIRKKITPEQNTAASACCQVYLMVSTTVKAKNALSPMPGASAIG